MNEANGYAVFFFPQALEALGEAVKPYLQDGAAGPHVLCNEIDTSGALVEMTMRGATGEGKPVALELMVPTSMVRMIVSSQSDGAFGFGPRHAAAAVAATLPTIGPTAAPVAAQPASLPEGGADKGAGEGAATALPTQMDGAKPSP
ncbi:MAG: hypothetical protein ACJ8GK_05870 [Luteimonas sp.]